MTIQQWEEFKNTEYWKDIKDYFNNQYKDICLNILPHINSDELERYQGKLELYKNLKNLPDYIIKLKEDNNGYRSIRTTG